MAEGYWEFVRAQRAMGAVVDTAATLPGDITENFICVFYFQGRENVDPEKIRKLSLQPWMARTAHDGGKTLQVCMVSRALPTAVRGSWDVLMQEVKRVYYATGND